MKFIYVTDLHGRTAAYEKALERALNAGVKVIVNGGDLYPVGRDLFQAQREFLLGWFRNYLERLAGHGIKYVSTLGNMDLHGHDSLFCELMREAGNGITLLDEKAQVEGWTFIGSPMTTDAPFALKDRCLRDTPDSKAPPTGGIPLLSDCDGIHQAPDWAGKSANLPTLGEHLDSLPVTEDPLRTVYVLHQPPHGLGQGIIDSGMDVGSRAVRAFLGGIRPRLSLHGHIHESPYVGGQWRAELDGTVCIQPGQLGGERLVSVLVDIETLETKREQ